MPAKKCRPTARLTGTQPSHAMAGRMLPDVPDPRRTPKAPDQPPAAEAVQRQHTGMLDELSAQEERLACLEAELAAERQRSLQWQQEAATLGRAVELLREQSAAERERRQHHDALLALAATRLEQAQAADERAQRLTVELGAAQGTIGRLSAEVAGAQRVLEATTASHERTLQTMNRMLETAEVRAVTFTDQAAAVTEALQALVGAIDGRDAGVNAHLEHLTNALQEQNTHLVALLEGPDAGGAAGIGKQAGRAGAEASGDR